MDASARDDTIILLRDISLTLPSPAGEVNILRGIDLRLNRGEAVAVVGPSGSGKSTLMMIAAGLESASNGSVEVAGIELNGRDEDELAAFRRDNVGIVFQSFHLIPTMNALENVAVPLELAGRGDAMEKARELLEMVGLGKRMLHYPSQLSGGEQQRVAVARAFVAKPRLLLADEPTGNLDHAAGEIVIDLLFDLRRRSGATLLLITHDLTLASRCDRVLHMQDGKFVDQALTTS